MVSFTGLDICQTASGSYTMTDASGTVTITDGHIETCSISDSEDLTFSDIEMNDLITVRSEDNTYISGLVTELEASTQTIQCTDVNTSSLRTFSEKHLASPPTTSD
jgi:predicted secreted hydrolase